MRLIPSSMALPHTMISIAALHQARRKPGYCAIKHEHSPNVRDGAGSTQLDRTMINTEDPSALYDSLKHKQHALKQIQKELLNVGSENIEGTLASILLLAWQDTIDSGTDSWKYHLDALKGIAKQQKNSTKPTTKPLSFDFQNLEQCFEMTYAA